MDQQRFWVRFKDGRTATEQTDWVEPLDQLLKSQEVECGWLDLESPYAVDLEELQSQFGFNEHAIADCRQFDQRAKLEVFDGHSFWVCHTAVAKDSSSAVWELDFLELHGFLTPTWCVTVHQSVIPALDQMASLWSSRLAVIPRGPGAVWASLMERIFDSNLKSLSGVSDRLDTLDQQIATRKGAELATIDQLHHIKMALKGLRRLTAPQVEYLRSVSEDRIILACATDRLHYRAVKDSCQLLVEKTDLAIEESYSIRDSHAVAATLAANRTMARLTAFSVVFMPISFVTGFFGMNFMALPVGDPRWLWAVMIFCSVTPWIVLHWIRSERTL